MTAILAEQIDRLVTNALDIHRRETDSDPSCLYDTDWPSPCIGTSNPQPGQPTHWQPVRQTRPSDMFARLSEALEIDIHPDIALWFTRYWSGHVQARHADGELTLLQCWNDEDMERLRANQLGHLLAKRKQRQPLSLFFACTDGDEFMTLNNKDGSIWLERPGRKPLRQLADSLPAFIDALTPLPFADLD